MTSVFWVLLYHVVLRSCWRWVGVPSNYFVLTQLQSWLFCCWGCGCYWAVTITLLFNQIRSCVNLKVDELVAKAHPSLPIWCFTKSKLQTSGGERPFIALLTMSFKIFSKDSLNGDLKSRKSINRRILRYFKSRSIMQGLSKYAFLKIVCGIYPASTT